jgi:hypothetical protein
MNCTLAIGLLPAVADAETVAVPVSEASLAGEEIEIVGGVATGGGVVLAVPNV